MHERRKIRGKEKEEGECIFDAMLRTVLKCGTEIMMVNGIKGEKERERGECANGRIKLRNPESFSRNLSISNSQVHTNVVRNSRDSVIGNFGNPRVSNINCGRDSSGRNAD